MSNSHLDAGQVLPLVLDEVNDALQVNVVAGSISVTNPSVGTNGSTAPTSSTETSGINPSGNLTPLGLDSSGNLKVISSGGSTEATLAAFSAKTAASLVPQAFSSVALTYVASGNGVGQVATAIYSQGASVVRTLTLLYDASNRLSGVVAS